MVKIIREERPDIICPTFLDVPGQHGHHRAMTAIAIEAFGVATDPAAFPDQLAAGLAPWQAGKLYLPAWSGAGDSYDDDLPPPPATVTLQFAGRDPLTGASMMQIGEWSRRFHLTQGMGRWTDAEERHFPLHLLRSSLGATGPEAAITDGLPGDLGVLAGMVGDEAGEALRAVHGHCRAAFAAWPDDATILREASAALRLLRAVTLAPPEAALHGHRLARKERELAAVIALALGVEARASLHPREVAPGGQTTLAVHVAGVPGAGISARLAPGFGTAGAAEAAGSITRIRVRLAADAPLSDGYAPRHDAQRLMGNGALGAILGFAVDDLAISLPVDPEEPLQVLPAVAVALEPDAIVHNRLAGLPPPELRLTASAEHATTVRLGLGGTEHAFTIPAGGSATLQLPAPLPAEAGHLTLPVTLDGRPAMTVRRADHAHTGALARATPAVLRLRVLDAALPEAARIAYVGAAMDRVPSWLARMGLDVTALDAGAVTGADFARFTTVIIGVFGFKLRPELGMATPRLHRFVQDGGHLLTLYHRPADAWEPTRTPLAPLTIGHPSLRWRVTDPAAPVTRLQPDHPLLAGPNRITDDDFAGWVKERGLYFASAWDSAYAPLLAMSDAGEAPLTGSLLSGRFGKGRHTHTSLVLHTQMDALVPGAFRLMANLVAPAS
jgi:hypothetical protein